ncbi:hypothetical protein TGAMA5MH_01295 [Trichoderma gamsii]|uniref:Fucose-specific lectin n=1 Tax=Trichoderma gamsii TaxID=398673 RepID=A0A2K0TPN2_9HYPO|nr:hypothetical protein TGAMA5MH_01295 [Trichoderma gamsii]
MSTTLSHDSEGLEVVPGSDNNVEGLEVAHNHGFDGLEASPKVQTAYGLEAVSKDGSSNMDNIEGARWSKSQNPRRKRLWLIIAAVVLVLVIVGAVVGGVVGSRSNHKALATPSSSSTPSPSTSAPSSSTTASSIDASSGIGVTGWWSSDSDFSIRLAYQGDDSYLHMMQYNSGDDDWSTMTILTNLDVKQGSPIALSCFNNPVFSNSDPNSDNNYTQIEIFYISDRGYVAEWWIREQQVPEQRTLNGNGSMSPNAWKAGVGSRFTSYWPSVIVQDDTSQLQEIYYNGSWSQKDLGLACQNHSAFAEIPVSIKGGLIGAENFIYQRDDQKLFVEGRKDSTASASTVTIPAITMPAEAAIGAFAIPRSSASNAAMNNYILWQNATGAIQMTWEDDNTGWRTSSTPESLGTPDKGTGITCLTPTLWAVGSLQPGYSMARCYYLVDGRIREIQYDGSNWSVVGNVI